MKSEKFALAVISMSHVITITVYQIYSELQIIFVFI